MSEPAWWENHKALFAAIATQDDLSPYDAVVEVRAMRAEKDVEDERAADARSALLVNPSCAD